MALRACKSPAGKTLTAQQLDGAAALLAAAGSACDVITYTIFMSLCEQARDGDCALAAFQVPFSLD